ncbi:hypothetical protein ROLI_027350 [Roseobacter fucihabitans]|uniref:Uncharacterized protein n=1 Tax=Roseobacter fucihabitans TaxID=1537242 RepID=A0ABZ2BUH6_9RHOB|nr:hypothetical protein [Roseobacter litoralis]MBC6966108.1 hypothetical protein [Roseobacter litoralis]
MSLLFHSLYKAAKPLLWLMSAFLTLSNGAASASEFCENMKVLTAKARSNFETKSTQPAEFMVLKTLPDAKKCTLGRALSGGNTYHCAWNYPFRDDAANMAFEAFNLMMRECFKNRSEKIEDTGVNHPDTYYQIHHILDEVVVSVSLKDKSSLQETYLFVGIQGKRSD